MKQLNPKYNKEGIKFSKLGLIAFNCSCEIVAQHKIKMSFNLRCEQDDPSCGDLIHDGSGELVADDGRVVAWVMNAESGYGAGILLSGTLYEMPEIGQDPEKHGPWGMPIFPVESTTELVLEGEWPTKFQPFDMKVQM